ncbi:MAG: FAD-dependent monooxygenase [Candidatus Protistobacter heckmanni]|nr:FAD-dependent monooxygenase [Candidatus Protistobacter heckmanni]
MQPDSHTFSVAVVGGGLAGKACALALAQLGLQVALVAPPQSAESGDRVYAFSQSTADLLERLRVWQALDAARMQPVSEMHIWGDAARGADAALQLSAYAAGVQQLAWIAQAGLIDAGLDAALRFSTQVTIFTQAAQELRIDADCAEVVLAGGACLCTACVIGADGGHSWTRERAGIAVDERAYGQIAMVANFSVGKPHRGVARQWFLGGGAQQGKPEDKVGEILALLPMPEDRVSMVWSARAAHAKELLALDPDALAARVNAAADGAVAAQTGGLSSATQSKGFPLALRRAAKLAAPRVALVADAAHVIHPLAGQGINLGLRDVAELARVFAEKESFRDLGDARLLRRYERARQADIAALVLATDGLQILFSLPGPLPGLVRNLGLRAVGAVPPLRNFLVERALA